MAAGRQISGAATTTNMNPAPPTAEQQPVEEPFTVEEINALAGDLKPGEIGWVKLDEEGTPTGAAVKEMPKDDGSYAKVVGAKPAAAEEVLTPSGAPLTKHMNPDPQVPDLHEMARVRSGGAPAKPPEKPESEKKLEASGRANPLVTGGNPPADTAHPTTKK
jgi:hypothetical protein